MTTLAAPVWMSYMVTSCDLPDYPSAVFSGHVGDPAHAASGGYHISIEDQVNPNNFSIVLAKDKAPPGNWARNRASAGDKSMSTADMIREWNRYLAVFNNPNDPRRKYIRAYNGWNGVGEAERLDFAKGTRTITTPDHRWHSHREGYRCFWNDPELGRAFLSTERAETVAQYNGEDEDMNAEQDLLLKGTAWRMHTVINDLDVVPTNPSSVSCGVAGQANGLKARMLLIQAQIANIAGLTEEQINDMTEDIMAGLTTELQEVLGDNVLNDDDLPEIQAMMLAAAQQAEDS